MEIKKKYKGFNIWISEIKVIEIILLPKGRRKIEWFILSKDDWILNLYFFRINFTTLPF